MSMHIEEKLPLIFGVPRAPFYDKLSAKKVFVAELRPGLEGMKVVAKELLKRGVQPVMLCDNMIAYCMKNGLVREAYIFFLRRKGKDFICRTGSFIVALCSKAHSVPLYSSAARREGKKPSSLLKIGNEKVTIGTIKTYVPLLENVPCDWILKDDTKP